MGRVPKRSRRARRRCSRASSCIPAPRRRGGEEKDRRQAHSSRRSTRQTASQTAMRSRALYIRSPLPSRGSPAAAAPVRSRLGQKGEKSPRSPLPHPESKSAASSLPCPSPYVSSLVLIFYHKTPVVSRPFFSNTRATAFFRAIPCTFPG